MIDPDLIREVEAIVFAAAEPLTVPEIARHLSVPGDVAAALAELNDSYAPRGIVLVARGGRWLFQTAPDLGHVLRRTREQPRKMSRAAVETLAIIAYHEPGERAPRSRTSAASKSRPARSTC